jgi:hypothetical protein
LLSDFSPYLNKSLVDEHFAFYGCTARHPTKQASLEAWR